MLQQVHDLLRRVLLEHYVTAAGTFLAPFGIEISPILSVGSARTLNIVESTSDLWGVGAGRSNPHAAILAGTRESPQAYVAYLSAAQAAVAADTSGKTTLSSYYKNCLASGTCSEVSFDSYQGGMVLQLDARFGKAISIYERYKVNVFLQGFNLTNRANYGNNYDVNIADTSSTFLKPLGFVNPNCTITP